jgi:hypothetical protein
MASGFLRRGKLKRIGLHDARPKTWRTPGMATKGGRVEHYWRHPVRSRVRPVSRILASGGPVETATPASKATTVVHRWPQFLPDGRHFLFYDRQAGATYLAT